MPGKGAHIIEIYIHAKNWIECVCGWTGDADKPWKDHKLEMRTHKPWIEKAAKKREEKLKLEPKKILF